MMKRQLWMVLAVWMIAACTPQKPATATDSSEIKTDSVGCVINRQGIKVALSADYPAGGEALQQSVAAFIWQQMDLDGDSLSAYTSSDGQTFIRRLAEAKYTDLKSMLDGPEDASAQQEDDAEPATTYTAGFKRVLDTGDYITLQGRWDSYVANTPHPDAGVCGITLRKRDGKPLGLSDILKNTDGKAFRQQLKEGIKKWLSDITETTVTTDEKMKELLGDDNDPDNMPLPEAAPFLVKEGIALPYGGYELVPHEPALIVIPFSADYAVIEP